MLKVSLESYFLISPGIYRHHSRRHARRHRNDVGIVQHTYVYAFGKFLIYYFRIPIEIT